jgi:putative heme transporter
VTASTTSGEGGEPPGGASPGEWRGRQVPTVDRLPGLHLPDWFQTLGRGAWLLVGIAVLLGIAFFVLGLISDLVIPLVFAAILAAIFVPLVDRLERWRLPRWLGAPLVVLLAIGVVSVIAWLVVAGLVAQGREILARVTAGLEETGSLPGVVQLDAEEALRTLGELVQVLVSGLLAGLGSAPCSSSELSPACSSCCSS